MPPTNCENILKSQYLFNWIQLNSIEFNEHRWFNDHREFDDHRKFYGQNVKSETSYTCKQEGRAPELLQTPIMCRPIFQVLNFNRDDGFRERSVFFAFFWSDQIRREWRVERVRQKYKLELNFLLQFNTDRRLPPSRRQHFPKDRPVTWFQPLNY